jgi:hypothetical protein
MVTTAVPPGKTWFDTHKTSFSDVRIDPDSGIDTASFLEAAEATTTLFGTSSSSPCTPKD